ncbi:MAG TPA: phosphoribosylanthranilate isomerase [Rudaea sp.]|nr:phosphoribosylanthranilate isomerase [Rudaea sp.]
MERVRVKFCGMTRSEDALAAARLGVDAIGLVLTRRSKRFAGVENARDIRRALPPFVAAVTLFMDDAPAFIAEVIATVRPDFLQFHGSEEAPDCVRYGLPYLKAVPMGRSPGAAKAMDGRERPMGDGGDWRAVVAAHPQAAGFLFDGNAAGEQGGSGRRFDWSQLPARLSTPVILAGGLTPENVGEAIRAARPYAVDVSSGIESAPGAKDVEKMRRFVAAVRSGK